MKSYSCRDDFGHPGRASHDSATKGFMFQMSSSKNPYGKRPGRVIGRTGWICERRLPVLLWFTLLFLALPRGNNAALTQASAQTFAARPAGNVDQACTPCPSSCTCARAGDLCRVQCSNLQEIPQPSDFPQADSLSHMILPGCSISHLAADIFHLYVNLQEIDLSNNNINSLDANAFQNQTNLQILNLTGNSITTLPPQLFAAANSLQQLYLTRNPVENLDSAIFVHLASLETLYLDGMQLHSLDEDIFVRNVKLQTLFLDTNSLSFLPTHIFQGLTELQTLSLKNNQLVTLTKGIFEDLKSLEWMSLTGNSWLCDCGLRWLKEWSQLQPETVMEEDFICSAPQVLQNSPVRLVESGQFVCDVEDYISCAFDFEIGDGCFIQFKNQTSTTQNSALICKQECFRTGSQFSAWYNNDQCLCAERMDRTTTGTSSSNTGLSIPATSSGCSCQTITMESLHTGQTNCGKLYISGVTTTLPIVKLGPLHTYSTKENSEFSVETDLEISSYCWNFGDDSGLCVENQTSVNHNFALAGIYNISLTIVKDNGTHEISFPVTVQSEVNALELELNSFADVERELPLHVKVASGTQVQVQWSRSRLQDSTQYGERCPSGWLFHGTKCYWQSGNVKANISGAEFYCASENAKLLTISSDSQMNSIMSLFSVETEKYLVAALKSNESYIWTVNGEEAHFNTSHVIDSSHGNCLLVGQNGYYGTDCGQDQSFICTQGLVTCQHDGTPWSDGNCYLLETQTTGTWQQARDACAEISATLVSIESEEKLNFLLDGVLRDRRGEQSYWTSLSDRDVEGNFIWDKGASVNETVLTLHNQHSSVGYRENCVYLTTVGQKLTLSVADCELSLLYVCQYPAGGVINTPEGSTVGTTIQSHTLDVVKEATSFESRHQPTTALLLPGAWFPHRGRLQSWRFRTSEIIATTELRLQVYRLTCQPDQIVIAPGCNIDYKWPFPSCARSPQQNRCANLNTIECLHQLPKSQLCSLTDNCLPRSSPCSCYGAANQSDICQDASLPVTGTESNWDEYFPGFKLVSETIVSLDATQSRTTVLYTATDIEIQPYDVIGIQHTSTQGHSPIQCSTISTSKWRNYILKADTDVWIQQLPTPTFPGNADWQENTVCEIEAKYSVPETVEAPVNLVKPYSLETGEYVFTANVFNSVSNQSVSGTVTMLYSVRGFDLILPNKVPIKPVSTQNNKLAVEAGVNSDFLWKITRGTEVIGNWNLSAVDFDFVNYCPEDLGGLVDCQRTGLQYIHTTYTFPFIGEEDVVSILFSASNPISSSQVTYDIVAQIPVTNLSLTLPEPAMFQVNTSLPLSTKIDSGSHVTYNWRLGDNEFTSDTGQTSYTFPAAGYYEVQVAASNDLGSLTSRGTVTLIAEANLEKLQIQVPSVVIAGNTATIWASVEINQYSMVSFYFDLGEGSTIQREDRAENLRTSIVANEAVQCTYSLDQHQDFNKVSITVIIVDNVYWNKTKTPLIMDMKDGFGSIWSNKTIEIVRGIQLAEMALINPAAAYAVGTDVEFSVVQTGGTGAMYYSWDFGDGSDLEVNKNGSIRHTFRTAGMYIISVEVSNNASSAVDSVTIYVEEPIKNLVLTYNGPTPIGHSTILSATTTAGSSVQYQFSAGDNTPLSSAQGSPNHRHMYGSVDKFNATVSASNKVSLVMASVWVYTMNDETLLVVDIQPDECVALSEPNTFKAVVVHMNPSNVSYEWKFGNGSKRSGLGLTEVTHTFGARGYKKAAVTATEVVGFEKRPRNRDSEEDLGDKDSNVDTITRTDTHYWNICVQERITGVEVVTNSPLALNGGAPAEVKLDINLTIDTGSDYTVTWIYGDTTASYTDTNTPTITYQSVGTYEVKITVENKVGKEVVISTIEVQETIETPTIAKNASGIYLSTKENYKFTSSVVHGTAVSYLWDIYSAQNSSHQETFEGKNIVVRLSEEGTHTVKLTASNTVSSANTSVELHCQDPVKNLEVSANSTSVPVGGSLSFTARVEEGSLVKYIWSLCEGAECAVVTRSHDSTYQHQFSNAGRFHLKVEASNDISTQAVELLVCVIVSIQNATITAENTSLVENYYASRWTEILLVGTVINGNEVTYSWTVYPPSGVPVHHEGSIVNIVLDDVGLYTIRLNASNVFSAESVEYKVESVQPVTSVSITSVNGSRGNLGDEMMFEAHLGNTVGQELLYRWSIRELGANSSVNYEETNGKITHIFNAYGAYSVSVEVSNLVSNTKGDVTISIAENVGLVEIVMDGQNTHFVRKGQAVLFKGSSQQGTSTRFEWLFTDSDPPIGYTTQDVSHIFNRVGQFKIELNVSNSVSFTSVGLTIYSEEIISNLSIGVNGTGPAGTVTPLSDPLIFVASVGKGSNLTYAWDFGEGAGLIENLNRTILHKFSSVGAFPVSVIVANDVSSAQKTVFITVQEKIKDLEVLGCCDQVVSEGSLFWFEAQISQGSDVSYIWLIEMPNGNTFDKTDKKFSHDLDQTGYYSVQLKASNKVSTVFIFHDLLVEEEIRDVKIDGPRNVYDGHYGYYKAIIEGGTMVKYRWKVNFVEQPSTEKTLTHLFDLNDPIFLIVWIQVEAHNNVSVARDSLITHVKLLECDYLDLHPIGGQDQSEMRSRTVHLEMRIFSKCERYPIIYTWEVFKSKCALVRNGTEVARLRGVDKRTPNLIIPAKHSDMQYGRYCARFTGAYDLDPTVETVMNIDLEITKSPLIAMITGGGERCFSSNQEILLDGSKSYDPDNIFSFLGYEWTCYTVNADNTIDGQVPCFGIGGGRGSKLVIPPDTLTPHRSYMVKLVVFMDHRQSDTATQILAIKKETVPVVSIECLSCLEVNNYVIPSFPVKFVGFCANCGEDIRYYKWTIVDDAGDELELNASNTSTGTEFRNLAIYEDVLNTNTAYTFKLSITADSFNGVWGYANMRLPPNQPPENGTCTISPTVVEALTQEIFVSCEGWLDTDGAPNDQLTYNFLVERIGLTGDWYPLYRGPQSQGNFSLAPWSGGNIVKVYIFVEDRQGGKTKADEKIITVTMDLVGDGSVTEYLHNNVEHLEVLKSINNPKKTMQYLIPYTTMLNSVSEEGNLPETDRKIHVYLRYLVLYLINETVTIKTIDDVQQLAYQLLLCTMYKEEFPQESTAFSQTILKLENIIHNLLYQASPATSSGDLVPSYILVTISNVIEALMFNQSSESVEKTNVPFEEMKELTEKVVNLIDLYLQVYLETQIVGERPLYVNAGYFSTSGQRLLAQNMITEMTMGGTIAKAVLPSGLLDNVGEEDTEVFQTMTTMKTNPFDWGYEESGLPVTSQVLTVAFTYAENKTEVQISNLPEDKRVQLWIPKIDNAIDRAIVPSDQYHVFLRPNQSLQSPLNISSLLRLGTAVHVEIKPIVPEWREYSVMAYLGHGYEPFWYKYDESLNISSNGSGPSLHTNYTFFIYNNQIINETNYYVTLHNTDLSQPINISLSIYQSACLYYNTNSSLWNTSGCSPNAQSNQSVTVCDCNHMTMFGASVQYTPIIINFEDLTNLDLADNPIAIIVITCIAVVYILIIVWAYNRDRVDLEKISFIPLCGRDGAFKYEVIVVTGRYSGSGTTANVGVQIYGEEAYSSACHLCKQESFQRSGEDMFLIATESSLGPLWKVLIWHDNTGVNPSWYLSRVIVRDLQTNKKYYFLCENWLCLWKGDGEIQRDLYVATYEDLTRFGTVLKTEINRGFAERHLWMSVLERRPRSRFTRVQRVTCLVTLLYTFLAVNMMWYGLLKAPTVTEQALGWITMSWSDVTNGLLTTIMVLPVNLAIMWIFKRSKCAVISASRLKRSSSVLTVGIDSMSDLSQTGDSFYSSYGLPSDIPSLSGMSSTESLAVAGKLHRSKPKYKRHDKVDNRIKHCSSSESVLVPDGRSDSIHMKVINTGEERIKEVEEEEDDAAFVPISRSFKDSSRLAHDKNKNRVKSRKRGDSTSDADDEASVIAGVTPRKTRVAKSRARSPYRSRKNSVTSQASDVQRRRRQGSNVSQTASDAGNIDCESETNFEVTRTIEKLPDKKRKNSGILTSAISAVYAKEHGHENKGFNPREDAKLDSQDMQNIIDEIDENLKEAPGEVGKNRKRTESDQGNQRSESKQGVENEVRSRAGSDVSQANSQKKKIKQSRVKKRWEQITLPSEFSEDYRDSDSDDPWYGSTQVSIRRSDTIRSVSSNTSTSSIFSRSIAQVIPRISNHPSKWLLPHCCVYMAYTVCLTLSAFSILVILLYGQEFGKVLAVKWLLACFVSIVESIIIVEPLKVLVLAIVLAFMARGIEDQDLDVIPTQPICEIGESAQDVKLKPLAGYALENARQEGEKLRQMRKVIRETISHIFLLWTVVVIAYMAHSDWTYYAASNKLDVFVSANRNGSMNFTEIKTIDDWWNWTETTLTPGLFQDVDLNINDQEHLIGVARMRQVRFIPDECLADTYMKKRGSWYLIGGGCFSSTKDTRGYAEGWILDPSSNATWMHRTDGELDSGSYLGVVDSYSGDGYVQLLGSSSADTLSILGQLNTNQWIDRGTRVVIVEFTMFSPSHNFHSVVRLAFELPVSGGVITSHDIRTYRAMKFVPNTVDVIMVLEVLFSVIILYFVIYLVYTLVSDGPGFLLSFWGFIEVIMTCLGLAQIIIYIQRMLVDTALQDDYLRNTDGYTSFVKGVNLADDWNNLTAVLVFIMTIWVARQLRFIRWMSRFSKTLRKAKWYLVGCCIIFTHITVGYAGLGYLWYGTMIATFHSFGKSIVTQFGLSAREAFLIDEMNMHSRIFTGFFISGYFLIVLIFVTGLFVSVLTRSLLVVKQQMFYNNTLHMHDHELVDFIVKRFKQWAGITKPKPAFRRVKFHGMAPLSTHSSWSSRMWQTASFMSNTSSDMSYLTEDEVQPYLQDLLHRAVPTWETMCDKLDEVSEMYEEETELVKLVEKTIRDAKRSPEKINRNMVGKSLGPKPARKQSKVYVEDFGFDESPVIRRNRSKSDPYAGLSYSSTNGQGLYGRSLSHEATVSSEDIAEAHKERTRKLSMFNGSNKITPLELHNVDRPQSELAPYIKGSKRPQSDQSPRQQKKKTEEPWDSNAEVPESKAAWQGSDVYV